MKDLLLVISGVGAGWLMSSVYTTARIIRELSKIKSGNKSRVTYSSYYKSRQSKEDDYFIFETRNDAQNILDSLTEILDLYSCVSLSDYNDLVGVIGPYTDNKIGWTNLDNVKINMVRGGYRLLMPRKIILN